MQYHLGVDIGGTTTTLAIGNQDREVVAISGQFETRSAEGPAATIAAIVENATRELAKLGASLQHVRAVGLATPGPATREGVLLKTPNLDPALWDQCPIRTLLETAMRQASERINVTYIGDGQAAALGEFSVRTGAVQAPGIDIDVTANVGVTSLFMVIVGTGLGGGYVRKGKVVRGSRGRAGHVGHLVLPRWAFRHEHDRRLRVGNAFCTAESACSLTGLTHQLQYRLSLEDYEHHPLNKSPGNYRAKAKRLRELAAQGDDLALELFDDQARALGITLLNVNYLGDYDRLVIGGGVCDLTAELRERYRLAAEAAYRQYALSGFSDLDRLEFSVCGDDAPVVGALTCAYELDA
ncbi:MAG: ROK family protein [Planctomycetaceae bacterium]|nr:ROK family protein [Planctomycetaceae bacterium]